MPRWPFHSAKSTHVDQGRHAFFTQCEKGSKGYKVATLPLLPQKTHDRSIWNSVLHCYPWPFMLVPTWVGNPLQGCRVELWFCWQWHFCVKCQKAHWLDVLPRRHQWHLACACVYASCLSCWALVNVCGILLPLIFNKRHHKGSRKCKLWPYAV